MLNPAILGLLQAGGIDLRKTIIDRLTPTITTSLQKSVEEVQVYEQTRSIVGSVKQLYDVGSPVPATLILLFSVVIPFGKAALVAWAHVRRRRRAPPADAGLRGSDCQVVDGRRLRRGAVHRVSRRARHADAAGRRVGAPPLVAFTAHFRAGFYWFAAYCLFSLASQQYTRRLVTSSSPAGSLPEQPAISSAANSGSK